MYKGTVFKVKRAFFLTVILLPYWGKAQFVVTDPSNTVIVANQTTQISQAISALKQGQQMYQSIRQEGQQLEYIKNYMQDAENRLKNIGSIKDLKLNDLETILDKVLCLKAGNYMYQSVHFMDIVSSIRNAYGKCANTDVFKLTFAGVKKQLVEQFGNQNQSMGDFFGQLSSDNLVQKQNELEISISNAHDFDMTTQNNDKELKLELAFKYKDLSDELMKMSDELSKAINAQGVAGVQVDPGQRLSLMAKAMDYQLKSVAYEEKSAALMKDAGELSKEDTRYFNNYQKQIQLAMILKFRS